MYPGLSTGLPYPFLIYEIAVGDVINQTMTHLGRHIPEGSLYG